MFVECIEEGGEYVFCGVYGIGPLWALEVVLSVKTLDCDFAVELGNGYCVILRIALHGAKAKGQAP